MWFYLLFILSCIMFPLEYLGVKPRIAVSIHMLGSGACGYSAARSVASPVVGPHAVSDHLLALPSRMTLIPIFVGIIPS